MNSKLVKLFYKKRCVKAIVIGKNKHITATYVVPKTGILNVGGRAYNIDHLSPFIMSGTIPSYIFVEGRTKPVDVTRNWSEQDNLTDKELKIILDSNFLEAIAMAQKGVMDKKIMMFGAVIAVVVLAVGYMLYTQNTALQAQIKALQDLLTQTTGG